MLVESEILGFRIQNTAHGIPPTIGIRNPNSTYKDSEIKYLESGIHGEESRIQDCLGFQPRKRSMAIYHQPVRKLSIWGIRENSRENRARKETRARGAGSRGPLAIIGELARRVLVTMNPEPSPLYLP